jgi:hypothetical protein
LCVAVGFIPRFLSCCGIFFANFAFSILLIK